MISRELIDLVNSGDAVAIVGSGVSTEAGLPSWGDLFSELANELDKRNLSTLDARSVAAQKKYPEAFDRLAALTTRDAVHAEVSALVRRVSTAGRHHGRLADWPLRFYVTTNYDHLLERASNQRLVPVGNRGAELHKVSADVRDIVWHLHGGCDLASDASQLVIGKADYDDFYPASNAVEALKAVTRLYRCIFVGFGFNDEDFIHVLKTVGRLSHSGRPSFAFLAYDDASSDSRKQQEDIRSTYNVEVIPYYKQGHDHSELHRLLDGYGPFVLRRSVSYGSRSSGTPGYEPVASSLRVQSSLDLGELSAAQPGLHRTLIGTKVLAKIRECPGLLEAALVSAVKSSEVDENAIRESLALLRKRGLVTEGPRLDLTSEYNQKTTVAQANLELARDRFLGSMRERAGSLAPGLDGPAQARVVNVVSGFLEELCRERGLGVAQNLATSDATQASRRTVALLQQLPHRLNVCATRDEAISAVHVASDLLTRPTEAESTFLGMLCQCYFGQHLVGASDRLSKVDLDLIGGTCYVLDASVLVCVLAEGSQSHGFALKLIQDLQRCGATLVTTDLFVDEVAEHVNWALRTVAQHGEHSSELMDALRCTRGYRPNQFLQGFYLGAAKESSLQSYVARVLATAKTNAVATDVVTARLRSHGIMALTFDGWVGFDQKLFAERDALQQEVAKRRERRGTYKHRRQTQAEAEVALVVDRVRSRRLQPPGATVNDAFFLSSTRVVDCLPNLQRRISLLPEGLAQWIWSCGATSSGHAELVFEQLLWELAHEGVEFVDRRTLLRKFSGVVEAAQDELASAIKDRREYLVTKYGPDPAKAFADADPLDIPWLAKDVQREALDRMQQRLSDAQKREVAARAAAKMTEKERGELARLRMKQEERHKKALRKQRAAASRKGKKRGRKKGR